MDYGLYNDVNIPFIAGKIWHGHSKYWNMSNISIQRMRQLNVIFFSNQISNRVFGLKMALKCMKQQGILIVQTD